MPISMENRQAPVTAHQGTAGGGDGAAKGRLTMIYAAVGLLLLGFVYVVILIYNQLVA